MLNTPILVTALTALLGGGSPFPPDAPRDDEPSKLSDEAVERALVLSDVPPPGPRFRFNQTRVALPVALGLCLGMGAGVFYKLAADQDALLRTEGAVRSHYQLIQITDTGARNQVLSAVLAGAGLASLGLAGFLAFSPEPAARPSVSVTPTAGGAAAVLHGSW